MPEVLTDHYVQVNTVNGWWTVFKGTDKHQAAALAAALDRGWDAETRSVSSYVLQRKHGGMEMIHEADSDLAALEDDTRAEIADLAETAGEVAEDALPRVANAKLALEQAERYLRQTMLMAQECDYSLRDISAVAGLSASRVHQMISEVTTAVA